MPPRRAPLWWDTSGKPPFGMAALDEEHPEARALGAGALWLLNESAGYPHDLVSGSPRGPGRGSGGPVWAGSIGGIGPAFAANYSINTNRSLYLGTGDFTIEVWFITTNPGSFEVFLGKDADGGRDWNFNYSAVSANKVSFTSNISGASATSAASIASGALTHALVTRIGTAVQLYLNGAPDGTAVMSDNFNASNSIFIGSREYNGFEQFMTGQVLFAALRRRGMTAGDVRARYATPYALVRSILRRHYEISTST